MKPDDRLAKFIDVCYGIFEDEYNHGERRVAVAGVMTVAAQSCLAAGLGKEKFLALCEKAFDTVKKIQETK